MTSEAALNSTKTTTKTSTKSTSVRRAEEVKVKAVFSVSDDNN